MSAYGIIAITGLYLGFLFLVAGWGKGMGRAFLERYSGYFYGLGLGVYATAWTFYGSIGRAATHGLDFLAIYLGPILFLPVWWTAMRKIVRISKAQHLNSLSDFITARYGKNWSLAIVVTLLVVMAITPYLALQIKAISSSANVLLSDDTVAKIDLDLVATLVLLIFTLFYGIRFSFDDGQRFGLIATIGVESIIKVVAAFVGGWIIVRTQLGGTRQVYESAVNSSMTELLTVRSTSDWMLMMLISGIAFFLLPRQFQMAVVSNRHEKDLRKALWIIPLFLLLMNWWVVPIALGGSLSLPKGSNADYHFLSLALQSGSTFLPILVFLGGLAACTSMIIVSSSALASMVSSNLILPLTLKRDGTPLFSLNPIITQRLALLIVFGLAYFYYTYVVQQESLVSIGMISFIGIAQLAPGFISALYWREATSKGVLAGLLVGFVLWLSAFGVPQWLGSRSDELFLFNVFPQWSALANITFISLTLNSLVMVGISLLDKADKLERNQAEFFFNVLSISTSTYNQSPVVSGKITFERLENMLLRFMPDTMVSESLYKRYTIDRIDPRPGELAPAAIVSYAERLMTQMMGPVTSRIVLHRELEGEMINTFDIQDIIKETQETVQLNAQLQEKTDRLANMTKELTVANDQLKSMGKLKDDFLYTVTHELRSPLTAIRAQIELIRDDEAMPLEVQHQFLDSTIEECQRLTHLISSVLDIEKFESGNQQLSFAEVDLNATLKKVLESHAVVAQKEGIQLKVSGEQMVKVRADRDRMQQVLINLISNAIKYAKSEVTVKLEQNESEGRWVVHTMDDGPGVAQGDIPHLFEKFYQSNDQTVKKRLGTGLGLAISHNIIKAHRGSLELSNNPPKGQTTFTFTLPKN